MTFKYEVLLTLPQETTFTYTHTQQLELGTIVEVSFGKQVATGIIWENTDPKIKHPYKLKPIQHVWHLPPISAHLRKLIHWVSEYYLYPKGYYLKMILAGLPDVGYSPRKTYEPFLKPQAANKTVELTPQQTAAAQSIQSAIQSNAFHPFLLDGVTGSGKTEVYYEAVCEAINNHQQVLILLPEITLTQQWLDRFQQRFGVMPARWHSGLKQTERLNTWQQIIQGKAHVIVGARSALFLPMPNLGLIVVDEEHDSSYKQDEGANYHARDIAVLRAQIEQCTVVLASATPSIETYANAQQSKYKLLQLSHRFGSAGTPTAHIVDLKHKSEGIHPNNHISQTLHNAIEDTLKKGEQAILFLNRRGFAPVTICSSCGHKVSCPNCSFNMVMHHNAQQQPHLQCHHCGTKMALPKECPECHETDTLNAWGVGIQKLTEQTHKHFPTARVLTVSSDHINNQKQLEELYSALKNNEVDIVIGTQIMAKGHDFSNVTLVGIIDADSALMNEDIRAGETTYQLLHQVAGRCGRGDKPGNVYIQTFTPNHPVIEALQTFDRDAFLNLELENREAGLLPPFGRQVAIIVSAASEDLAKEACLKLLNNAPTANSDILILGPAPAPLYKLRNNYRFRFLVQSPKETMLQSFVKTWVQSAHVTKKVKVTIDIDPLTFF